MKKLTAIMISILLLTNASQAFDMKDLKNSVDKSYKCKEGDQGCKNREHLKAAAKVAAVAVAAKYITDMVIDYRSKKVDDEASVATVYKNEYHTLPAEPLASTYTVNTLPGSVVEPGKKVTIQSDMVVIPGTQRKDTLIEERLAIFDNEDNTKELKSLTKAVNEDTKRGGRYTNEFSFTLPEGLPQGIYPIKTALLLNGKTVNTADKSLQLVLHIDTSGKMHIVASL